MQKASPLFLCVRLLFSFCLVLSCAATVAHAAAPVPLVVDGFGKGTVLLDGPWQFHTGDNPSWAQPGFNDSQWEQLTADAPWGAQGHYAYTGYAWYRKRITVNPAPGADPNIALMIPAIDDAFELYWNGQKVGALGKLDPPYTIYELVAPQTFGLGQIRSGVLAIRVLKLPLASNDPGELGGSEKLPVLGSPTGIANLLGNGGFKWLRGKQFHFALTSLYVLTSILSFLAWLRLRDQRLLLWMAIYTLMPLAELFNQMGYLVPFTWLTLETQTAIQVREISQWFLLVYLLQLDNRPGLMKLMRWGAWITVLVGMVDGSLAFFFPALSATAFQLVDAILTALILPQEVVPVLLVVLAIVTRRKLDSARWAVATLAVLNAVWYAVSNIAAQGIRFTHWTLADKMGAFHISFFGSNLGAQLLMRSALFLAIVYAVGRYAVDNLRRQTTLEREFQNAKELQQVLIPQHLPELAGFAVTSAYRPAAEVGGDFFQILPLQDGAALVVVGDVSGKGLKAAMTVSLIVGALHTLTEITVRPGEILAGLNRRLAGRIEDGFATCLVLLVSPAGVAVVASAGHPAPLINGREVEMPGNLPLGIIPGMTYAEETLHLEVGDHLALYTDGLLEARGANGELFGFHRVEKHFAGRPNAEETADAAVAFGQDDDITVLTLTRLAAGIGATVEFSIPSLAR